MKGRFLALILFSFIFGECYTQDCPAPAAIDPCKCFENSKEILCEDTANEFNGAELFKKFNTLAAKTFKVLYIHNTKIEIIKADTFRNLQFDKIFIADNSELADIEPTAFTVSEATSVLSIRNNIKLKETNVFKVAKSVGKALTVLELDKNSINNLAAKDLNDGEKKLFQLITRIRLDSQNGGIKSIAGDSIGNLPILKQLSLNDNKIEALSVSSIDLTSTTLANNEHITIFLNDNVLKDITIEQLKVDTTKTKPSIYLDLENNKIESLKDGIFDKIVSQVDGNVFLKGNDATIKCECKKIKELQNNMAGKHKIQGLKEQKMCVLSTSTNKVEIKDCA